MLQQPLLSQEIVLHSAQSRIFLVLRSLASFPAPHVSPTCAFGCRSRGDVLGLFPAAVSRDLEQMGL